MWIQLVQMQGWKNAAILLGHQDFQHLGHAGRLHAHPRLREARGQDQRHLLVVVATQGALRHLRFHRILHKTTMAETFHGIHGGWCNGCLSQGLLDQFTLLRTRGCCEGSPTACMVRMSGSDDAIVHHFLSFIFLQDGQDQVGHAFTLGISICGLIKAETSTLEAKVALGTQQNPGGSSEHHIHPTHQSCMVRFVQIRLKA
mmetsp:Transcript_34238/g.42151  ORF Transcript_34238/g.42151 Transcript_34238/m.42151 type:complete len:201 (-) Transcript_34238:71-673(-)